MFEAIIKMGLAYLIIGGCLVGANHKWLNQTTKDACTAHKLKRGSVIYRLMHIMMYIVMAVAWVYFIFPSSGKSTRKGR